MFQVQVIICLNSVHISSQSKKIHLFHYSDQASLTDQKISQESAPSSINALDSNADDNSTVLPIDETSVRFLRSFVEYFWCFDFEDALLEMLYKESIGYSSKTIIQSSKIID
jgi:hypothetical protein